MHLYTRRASVAQSHAQTALSAVRDRVQRKLSETPSSSMVARQQDQQPLSSRVYSRLQGISRAVNQVCWLLIVCVYVCWYYLYNWCPTAAAGAQHPLPVDEKNLLETVKGSHQNCHACRAVCVHGHLNWVVLKPRGQVHRRPGTYNARCIEGHRGACRCGQLHIMPSYNSRQRLCCAQYRTMYAPFQTQLTGYTTVEHLKEAVAKADEDLIQIRQDMERKKQAFSSTLPSHVRGQCATCFGLMLPLPHTLVSLFVALVSNWIQPLLPTRTRAVAASTRSFVPCSCTCEQAVLKAVSSQNSLRCRRACLRLDVTPLASLLASCTELCRMEHKTDADVAAAREAHEKAVSVLLLLNLEGWNAHHEKAVSALAFECVLLCMHVLLLETKIGEMREAGCTSWEGCG
eukprot:1161308-Pelagomonas_calceolata.AAC.10